MPILASLYSFFKVLIFTSLSIIHLKRLILSLAASLILFFVLINALMTKNAGIPNITKNIIAKGGSKIIPVTESKSRIIMIINIVSSMVSFAFNLEMFILLSFQIFLSLIILLFNSSISALLEDIIDIYLSKRDVFNESYCCFSFKPAKRTAF